MTISKILILLLFVFTCPHLYPQEESLSKPIRSSNLAFSRSDSLAVDQVVQSHIDAHYFEGVVLLAEGGNIVYQRAHGWADREGQRAIQAETPFLLASITKMFTSILILQYIEQGEIELSTSLDTLLSELKIPQAKQICIEDLLLHTSGLPTDREYQYKKPLAPDEFIKEILGFPSKGQRGSFRYNNVDYMLLGLILEKISGKSWPELLEQQIIQNLGLKNTGILYRDTQPKNFAHTYQVNKKGIFKKDPAYYIENAYAAGSLYANVEDLLTLDQALYSKQLLDSLGKNLLSRSFPQHGYAGYGVWNYTYPYASRAAQIMERRGGILGANVVLARLPEENKTLIILSNNDQFNPDSWGDPGNLREALLKILIDSAY